MPESSCGTYLLGLIPSGTPAKQYFSHFTVNAASEGVLKSMAKEDARRYIYNAVISFLGGLNGLRTQEAAWAVTRFYYTAFYIGRAALGRSDRIIFHVPKPSGSSGHTQYELMIHPGQLATVSKIPSTHKLVAHRFRELGYPPFMSGLSVNGLDPFSWLMEQREYWQYRAARFSDPDVPAVLDEVDMGRVQRLLEEYLADGRGLYLADPDHALLAVPFRLLIWALSQESLLSQSAASDVDLAYLRKRCRIGNQILGGVQKLLI